MHFGLPADHLATVFGSFPVCPESLKDLAAGKIKVVEVLNREALVSLGALIDPEYPKLLKAAPVRESGSRLRYAEWEMLFKLRLAFGRRST